MKLVGVGTAYPNAEQLGIFHVRIEDESVTEESRSWGRSIHDSTGN
jgi:hypothetical protein